MESTPNSKFLFVRLENNGFPQIQFRAWKNPNLCPPCEMLPEAALTLPVPYAGSRAVNALETHREWWYLDRPERAALRPNEERGR